MIREDFHTHTTYSDGKGSPEEMIRAALRAGMRRIGFSDHSYADCDPGSIPAGADAAYRAEIRQLAVAPQARGQGKGKALLQRFTTELDGRRITVWTAETNAAALRLYESAGFAPDGWQSEVLLWE